MVSLSNTFYRCFCFYCILLYTLFHRYDQRALVRSNKYIVRQPQLESIIVADLKFVPLGKIIREVSVFFTQHYFKHFFL